MCFMCVLMCVLCVYGPSAYNKTHNDADDIINFNIVALAVSELFTAIRKFKM